MDLEIAQSLSREGVSLSPLPPDVRDVPILAIATTRDGRVLALAADVPVVLPDDRIAYIRPKKISDLFAGVASGFVSDRPPDEYGHLIYMIIHTATSYCDVVERDERDVEMVNVYSHLRRRPDGTHPNPLFSYLQAAVRVYMSLVDVSRAQFESLIDCLRIMAKRFAVDSTTTGYLAAIRKASEAQPRTGKTVEPRPDQR